MDSALNAFSNSSSVKHPVRGVLYIALATFFWGFSAAMGRAVFTGRSFAAGHALGMIDPLMLSQARVSFAFLLLAPMLVARRGWGSLLVGRRDLAQFFLLGIIGMASSNYFYYLSILRTNVATAITLQHVAPVWVLLYMLLRRLQRPALRGIGGVLMAVLGCWMAVGSLGLQGGFPWLSLNRIKLDTLGLIATQITALTFAFYNVYAHHLLPRFDRWTMLLHTFLGASLLWIVVNPPWRIAAHHYTAGQWLFMVVFAITSLLVPYSAFFAGLRHLDPTRAIVATSLEPVMAIVLTALLLGESVGGVQVVGIVIVLVATTLVQLPDREPEGAGGEGKAIYEPGD